MDPRSDPRPRRHNRPAHSRLHSWGFPVEGLQDGAGRRVGRGRNPDRPNRHQIPRRRPVDSGRTRQRRRARPMQEPTTTPPFPHARAETTVPRTAPSLRRPAEAKKRRWPLTPPGCPFRPHPLPSTGGRPHHRRHPRLPPRRQPTHSRPHASQPDKRHRPDQKDIPMSEQDFGRPAHGVGRWPYGPPASIPDRPDPDNRTERYEHTDPAEANPGEPGPRTTAAPPEWPTYGAYTPEPEGRPTWPAIPAARSGQAAHPDRLTRRMRG